MKKIFVWLLVVLVNYGCISYKKFFDAGSVTVKDNVEEIKITMVNHLPFCTVKINGKEYQFLMDTGAPTVISEEIYESLNIKKAQSYSTTDSQKKKKQAKFTKLPELQMGNLIFKEVGCAVMKFDDNQLKCFGIDGIIGANMMAKLFIEFDYNNSLVKISNNISAFQVEKSDFHFDFHPKPQKTPMVEGKVLDKKISFTFDTGSNGYIKIPNEFRYYKNKTTEENFITTNGINSIGVYGTSKSDTTFVMKNTVDFDSTTFNNEIIDSGNSNLIGNKFLKDYVFLIDWQSNKIYFRKNEIINEKEIKGFGFSYLFFDGKAIVTSKIENKNIPINLGDEVLSINEVVFSGINSNDVCSYYLNKVEENKNEIDIKVKRNNEVLSFHLTKQLFIQ